RGGLDVVGQLTQEVLDADDAGDAQHGQEGAERGDRFSPERRLLLLASEGGDLAVGTVGLSRHAWFPPDPSVVHRPVAGAARAGHDIAGKQIYLRESQVNRP